MPKRPRIEVIARALISTPDAILLCRNVEAGYTFLPGGHVEFGEGARSALARELMEECNLPIRPTALALVSEHVFTQARVHHEVNLVFHVERDQWPAVIESLEPEIGFPWVPWGKLAEWDLRPRAIKDWLLDHREALISGAPRGSHSLADDGSSLALITPTFLGLD